MRKLLVEVAGTRIRLVLVFLSMAVCALCALCAACGNGSGELPPLFEAAYGATNLSVEKSTAWEDSEMPKSILAVIADPAKLDGERISTIGVLHIEFESDSLCLDRDSVRFGVFTNCLKPEFDLEALGVSRGELAQWNGRYVHVQGKVQAPQEGSLVLYPGLLRDIRTLQVPAIDRQKRSWRRGP